MQLEQNEYQTLAPYALKSGESRGRLHHESEPRYRTAFQRDRDRIVHAEAFRLLEYKTQVFVTDAGDYFRTRLTHTLEVSQIGRTLARALGANETLVETICLAHDLGHPPFGHAGESILNQLMLSYGGFNHNHQSYRVVTELENRYPKWSGLNLTYETLDGIAKHETEYDMSGLMGVSDETGASLEAQIANIADELAYNAHDLDDGLQSGLITTRQLDELEIWKLISDRVMWDGQSLDGVARHHLIRELVGVQVDDVLAESIKNIEQLNPQSPQDIQNCSHSLISHSDEQRAMNRQLKDFLYQNMYRHFRIVRMQERAEHFVSALFSSYDKEPMQLPEYYQSKLKKQDKYRTIADYIASLTDRGALREYRTFFDPVTRP
jgi:dGTPase